MKAIVIYKSKYGSTKTYAEWIAKDLGCKAVDANGLKVDSLLDYDTIVCGGGLYAEVIAGASLITKNLDKLQDKKLIIYTTGVTPVDCRSYYDDLVLKKNFKEGMLDKIKIFNFPGKMLLDELSLVHKAALKTLKKIMSSKENPTEMEKLLVELCDYDKDETNRSAIGPLLDYIKDN